MDRRSWLWRRKSSDKSLGETESSESISSHSERFSDDQVYPIHNSQSPEVTSKAAASDEEVNEVNDNVKALMEKLSVALVDISTKEDLVKQHSKVAEEAVSGWEKAGKEVVALKQQLGAATQKNSALEERVGHLDGALKECLRQLRQAREEQERKIQEAVSMKTREWESTKSKLESHLVEIQVQLQDAKTEAVASKDNDLRTKLEASEKENSSLKLELLSRLEELEIRIIERDLSTRSAEIASKQHLDSIKKVAKLEAECRRLKALTHKVCPANDHKFFAASSVHAESFTDSQSDFGDRQLSVETDVLKLSDLELNESVTSQSGSQASTFITDHYQHDKVLGRKSMVPALGISLMDDFLEMERLAALPETQNSDYCEEAGSLSNQPIVCENPLKAELEALTNRTVELEDKLENMEAEKVELKMALTECQKQLKSSHNRLKEAEVKLVELQIQLARTDESKQAADEEIKSTNTKREVAELQLAVMKAEIKLLHSKVGSLEKVIEKERALSAESFAKCRRLEDEVQRIKREKLQHEAEFRHMTISNGELKIKQREKELSIAASKFEECQKTIASLGQQLESLATLEDFLIDSKTPLHCHY